VRYWLFTPLGPPCVQDPPADRTRCGRPAADAREITEIQAQVWYRGQLCAGCVTLAGDQHRRPRPRRAAA
jgi:hypothetical protein